jgi:hypothetical protein
MNPSNPNVLIAASYLCYRNLGSDLLPAFDEGGTVTAGNASGINDAAAAVVLMSAERAEQLGAPVRGRIVSHAVCGVEPKTMGIGPVPAVRKALERAGKTLDQVDVVFGAWAVMAWVVKPTLGRLAGSLSTVYVGHQLISLLGYWLGMRTTAR